MANPQEAGPPIDPANVTPMDGGTAQTRQIVEAVKASVAELRQDVRDIKIIVIPISCCMLVHSRAASFSLLA